jgi:hypothetical protein
VQDTFAIDDMEENDLLNSQATEQHNVTNGSNPLTACSMEKDINKPSQPLEIIAAPGLPPMQIQALGAAQHLAGAQDSNAINTQSEVQLQTAQMHTVHVPLANDTQAHLSNKHRVQSQLPEPFRAETTDNLMNKQTHSPMEHSKQDEENYEEDFKAVEQEARGDIIDATMQVEPPLTEDTHAAARQNGPPMPRVTEDVDMVVHDSAPVGHETAAADVECNENVSDSVGASDPRGHADHVDVELKKQSEAGIEAAANHNSSEVQHAQNQTHDVRTHNQTVAASVVHQGHPVLDPKAGDVHGSSAAHTPCPRVNLRTASSSTVTTHRLNSGLTNTRLSRLGNPKNSAVAGPPLTVASQSGFIACTPVHTQTRTGFSSAATIDGHETVLVASATKNAAPGMATDSIAVGSAHHNAQGDGDLCSDAVAGHKEHCKLPSLEQHAEKPCTTPAPITPHHGVTASVNPNTADSTTPPLSGSVKTMGDAINASHHSLLQIKYGACNVLATLEEEHEAVAEVLNEGDASAKAFALAREEENNACEATDLLHKLHKLRVDAAIARATFVLDAAEAEVVWERLLSTAASAHDDGGDQDQLKKDGGVCEMDL